MDALLIARGVFEKEIKTLENIESQLDETFIHILNEIMNCKGKVIFIGMGKSGHVAKKIAASMSSLGTCAICLHPGECMHGDLGMIQKQDVIVLISYSGESEEILRIIPGINKIGATILGITCNKESSLVKACKYTQIMDDVKEACHLGLAPTSSTTAVMVYGDALAVAASQSKNFGREDFGWFHPAGSLGKKLTVRSLDLIHTYEDGTILELHDGMEKILACMLKADTDLICVVNEQGKLVGILTNGIVQTAFHGLNKDVLARDLMVKYPYFVDEADMAVESLKMMKDKGVHTLPVCKDGRPIGTIEKRDILKAGIYI